MTLCCLLPAAAAAKSGRINSTALTVILTEAEEHAAAAWEKFVTPLPAKVPSHAIPLLVISCHICSFRGSARIGLRIPLTATVPHQSKISNSPDPARSPTSPHRTPTPAYWNKHLSHHWPSSASLVAIPGEDIVSFLPLYPTPLCLSVIHHTCSAQTPSPLTPLGQIHFFLFSPTLTR